MHILYKPGPDTLTGDWLSSHNHAKNKDEEIAGLKSSINAISTATDILICMSIQDIQEATHNNVHLHELKEYIIYDHTRYSEMFC